MQKPVKEDEKKPYSPPRLIVYGTVRELTQHLRAGPTLDGGSFPLTHSSKVA